jgi:hypothetical protein
MIELLGYFCIMIIVSLLIQFIERQNLDLISTFLHVLAFIGVFIHEVSHYVMCMIFGVEVNQFKERYRNNITRKVAPHGSFNLPEFKKISLMQGFMVAAGPLFISTFLFLLCLDLIFTLSPNIIELIIVIFFALSLLIGSRASGNDMIRIFQAYRLNPRYSLYQVLLVVLSILSVLLLIDFSVFVVPFEFIIYIVFFICVIGDYFVLKYSFRLIYNIYRRFRSSYSSRKRKNLRRRHKPNKPSKSGIEEPQW